MRRLSVYPSMLALSALAFAADDAAAGGGADPAAAPGAAPSDPAPAAPAPAAAKAKPGAAPKVKLVTATVRRGTVMVGDHGSEKPVGPGGQVNLPEDEVLALRQRGVLVDPDNAPSVATGPKIENPE